MYMKLLNNYFIPKIFFIFLNKLSILNLKGEKGLIKNNYNIFFY